MKLPDQSSMFALVSNVSCTDGTKNWTHFFAITEKIEGVNEFQKWLFYVSSDKDIAILHANTKSIKLFIWLVILITYSST